MLLFALEQHRGCWQLFPAHFFLGCCAWIQQPLGASAVLHENKLEPKPRKREFFRNLGTSPAFKYSTHYSSQLLFPSPGLLSLDVEPFVPCYVLGRRAEFHLCFILVGVGYKLPGTRDINCQELGKLCLQAELLCTTSLLHIPSLPNLPAVLGDANLGSDPRRWERGENPLLSRGFGAGFGICWIMWLSRAFPSIPQRVFVCSSLVFNVSTNRVGYTRGRAGD